MSKLSGEVQKFFNETGVWTLSTFGDEPNAVPIAFKKIDENGNLVIYDVFLKKTLENISKNKKAAVTACNNEALQSYQIKGTASYSTDKALIDEGNAIGEKMNLKTKGAVIVAVEKVYVQTPGPDNGKLL